MKNWIDSVPEEDREHVKKLYGKAKTFKKKLEVLKQVKGENYLVPVNAKVQREYQLTTQTINVNEVLSHFFHLWVTGTPL